MRRVVCTDKQNNYENEKRDRRQTGDGCLIGQAFNCIRLLRRRFFCCYRVSAIALGSLVSSLK